MLHAGRCLSILLAAAVLACSPALNWREARFDAGTALRMLLPCKPDRAQRQVAMAGQVVELQMIGCDADGATFAVSHVRVADTADGAGAAALLESWKTVVLAHVRAQAVQEQAWVPPGGRIGRPSHRLHATASDADGRPLVLEAAWFAVPGLQGLDVYHAVMFSPRSRTETAETFFAGLASAP